jgi:hypothetical protein
MKRNMVFIVQMLWLVVLGALGGLYFIFESSLPSDPLGPIPIGAVWFGALGAVLISLNGIIDHAHDWDPSFDLWHLSRPLMGAALAVIGVIMLQAGILAVGATPSTGSVPKDLLYYLVAFLIGYREETFRELIKRLVDLVLKPAGQAEAKAMPTITEVQPSKASVAGHVPVVITGAGLSRATSVLFGSRPAEFHVDSDARVTAQLPDAEVAEAVAVVVKTDAGAATTTFQYAA